MIIGVLDYGAGNLRNVCRALSYNGATYNLISTAEAIDEVDRLVIPGVGAFKVAMKQLRDAGLVKAIEAYAATGRPMLGICLGMQLLFEKSYEFGETVGLGLIPGSVNLISSVDPTGSAQKVPHIGWNELLIDQKSKLLSDVENEDAVYFVHSYRAVDMKPEHLIAHCKYGGELIPAVVRRDNIYGCQFHPEKSGLVGLTIVANFLKKIE